MIVMGGIVGAGVFVNPHVVARQVHTPALILGAWLAGGLIALLGAFIYAELAARRPEVGGQYAYLRDAYHPAVAFLYGWALLLVVQTGGMAAVAITFSRYFLEVTRAPAPEWAVAATALGTLTVVNCFGVRAGGSLQSFLMVLKIAALAALVVIGLLFARGPELTSAPLFDRPASLGLVAALGAALTPVMFAYGGWQTASFVAGEMRDPRRDLARGLLLGVCGVIVLYTAVSFVCVYALGAQGLAETPAPASAVMRRALGERGATLIALGIAVSTLGFLSQGMLTAPRVYFAMARDRLFFRRVAWVDPRTRAPVAAIALQGLLAVVIAVSGSYEQILNYVVSVDFIWFGLTAATIFVFRRRAATTETTDESETDNARRMNEVSESGGASGADDAGGFRVPGHPWTTAFFIAACALIVFSTVYEHLSDSGVGLLIVAAGVPVYYFWSTRRGR